MEHFSLDKWLKDKSRKVVTRDGRSVRIVCWDKLDDRPAAKEQKIVALVKEGCKENVFMYNNNGDGCISALDLFFADDEEKTIDDKEMNSLAYLTELGYTCIPPKKEEELTEFEKTVQNIFNEPHFQDVQAVKQFSKALLDLTRKEILKNLPKWKKVDSNPANFQYNLQGKRLYKNGEYYIELSDLETLPKEE